jgi:hypothetical protein
MFINDIVVLRLGNVPLTLDFFILPLAASLTVFTQNFHINKKLSFICFIVISLEFIHAVISDFANETNWLRSFSLLVISISCFVIVSSFKIDHSSLLIANRRLIKISIFICIIFLVQFVLLQLGLPFYLPRSSSAVFSYYSSVMSYRYGGFIPAFGLSQEPSHQGLALTILLSYLYFSLNINTIYLRDRKLCYFAIATILVSVFITYSLSSIINTLLITSTFLICSLRPVSLSFAKIIKKIFIFFVTILLIIFYVQSDYAQPIFDRLSLVSQGKDNSTNVRLGKSTNFFWNSSPDLDRFFVGTGLGRQQLEQETYESIYNLNSDAEVNAHNVFTTVKILQGYIGVILYTAILWVCTRPLTSNFLVYLPLYLAVFSFHYSSGYYLNPTLWSLLALMFILRNIKLKNHFRCSQPKI